MWIVSAAVTAEGVGIPVGGLLGTASAGVPAGWPLGTEDGAGSAPAAADARVRRVTPTWGPPETFTGPRGFFFFVSSPAGALSFLFRDVSSGTDSAPGRGGSEENSCQRS